jgi:non-heme chloroperoxidase
MSTPPRETRYFDGAHGLRLAAECFGEKSNPTVLLFHGGGQTRHAWGSTAMALAQEGWYAVSFDLRGHGDSDWSDEGRYYFGDYAADTTALATQFDRPVLVGASLGGIASLWATAHAENGPIASALVLVDIATRMEQGGAERIRKFMTSRPEGFANLEEAADAIAAYNPHRKRPRDLSGLAKNLRQGDDGRYRWHWDPRFMQTRDITRARGELEALDTAAQRLELPVLLVRGRMSDLLSEEGARHFLDLVPHARFADVSGAGHMVAGDRNDAFTKAVSGFLRDDVHPSARAS